MVATARYLHLKAQELHEALMDAHITIGDNLEEKIRLRDQGPDIEASAQSAAHLTDQLAAMSSAVTPARNLPRSMTYAINVRDCETDWTSSYHSTAPRPTQFHVCWQR